MSDRIPAELATEIATIARDTTAPLVGFTLTSRDEILTRRGGGEGLKIYQDLARDGHAGSVLRKRRQAVVAREWTVEPGGERPEDLLAAGLIRAALGRIRFDRACQGLLGAVLTGIAVAEVMWEAADLEVTPEDGPAGRAASPRGGSSADQGSARPSPATRRSWIVPADIRVRNPRRFVFGSEGDLRLLTWDAPMQGIALPERKFILARFWAEENEDPYGRGLGHDLFWPVFFKRNGIALWNALLERWGQPFVYAEYPPGTPVPERQALLNALGDIARGAGLVVPQGSLVKMLEAGQGGSATGNPQAKLVEVMNAEISKIVLGETMTTEQGQNGARALGEVHDEVRQELADADADLLSAELAPLLEWITQINLPGAATPKLWRRKPEEPDLAARAKLDETLFKVGYEPTESYVTETYGPGYRRIAARPPQAPGATLPAMPPAEFAAGDGTPEAPERIAAILARDAEGPQQAMLAAVQAEVNAATSFEDLDERLLRLSAVMPIGPLAQAMAQAMALAGLAGQADVQDASDEARRGRDADAAKQ